MSERGGLVLCVGVTPAFQRTLRFSELTLGEVNRCSAQAQESASGKAANVARALQTLQGEAGNLELLGFLGGDTGKNYEKLLDVPAKNVYTAAATRICQTLLADKEGEATELVEEAINPSDDEWSQLLSLIESQLENAGILVLTGSPPPEANPTRYKQIVDIARGADVPVLLDCQKEPLREALASAPWLVKINREELEKTTGEACKTESDLIERACGLTNCGAQNVVVTTKSTVWLLSGSDTRTYTKFGGPTVKAMNPTGSGDSMAAGIAFVIGKDPSKLHDPDTLAEAIRLGIGCGAANAETDSPAKFDAARASELSRQVEIHTCKNS